VATLIDKPMIEGIHKVSYDASNLASGVYYYRLAFNGQVMTKKMLLVK